MNDRAFKKHCKKHIPKVLKNPLLAKGKRLVGLLMLILLVTRLFQTALELHAVRTGFIALNLWDMALAFLTACFSICIYVFGTRLLAMCSLGIGLLMMLQAVSNNLHNLNQAHFPASARLYALSFIAAAMMQIISHAFVLIHPLTRRYFNTMRALQKKPNQGSAVPQNTKNENTNN